MQFLKSPQGLIIFTGDCLWPQLDALAQWGNGLREVCVIAAHGDEVAGGAADRITAFITDFFPGVRTRVLGPVLDDSPADILATVEEGAAPGKTWLLEASGGSRLMFAGALLAGESMPHVKVVVRDADGPWYHVAPGGQARQLEGTDPRAADRFTVESLLDVTWSDDERNARVIEAVVEPEVLAAAEAVLAGAEWRDAFGSALAALRTREPGTPQSEGRIFERFILALVRAMGVQSDDVALSATLFDGMKAVQEVDVVVNSFGRLHVIDCKLLDRAHALPLGVQIREAYTTRRHLGDGADQYILLRPNDTIEEEFLSLCRAYDIRVVDRTVLEREPLVEVLRRSSVLRAADEPAFSSLAPCDSLSNPERSTCAATSYSRARSIASTTTDTCSSSCCPCKASRRRGG